MDFEFVQARSSIDSNMFISNDFCYRYKKIELFVSEEKFGKAIKPIVEINI